MYTFLGIILVIGAVAVYFYNRYKTDLIKEKEQSEENYISDFDRTIDRLPMVPVKSKYIFLLGFFIFSLQGLFFMNPTGTVTAVQYPWGSDKMVKTQGLKVKFWGKLIPMAYEIAIKDVFSSVNEDGTKKALPETQPGLYYRPATEWEFSDAIKAYIQTAVVISIENNDEEVFLTMADKNRSEEKLIYARVMPNIDAALKNTAKLMDAQEYISGKASDFDRYFKDQLENGMYLVEPYIQEEKIPEIIGDTSTLRFINPNTDTNKQTKFRIKRDENGEPIRDTKSNTLKQYGINILQAHVTGIDWEISFDERLQLQKEQVAQTQLEKQEAEKEFYRAKKEIAKGESEKAAERARLEKEQINYTMEAETEAKVAIHNLEAEKKKLEVAKLKAESQKILADAEAYKNTKMVSAGLTPQEEAKIKKEIAIGVAQHLKDLKLPEVVIQNGSETGKQSSTGLLESLIGAELAKQMLPNLTKK